MDLCIHAFMQRALTASFMQSILFVSIARDGVVTSAGNFVSGHAGTIVQADQVPPIWGAASDLVRAPGISLVPGPRSAGS